MAWTSSAYDPCAVNKFYRQSTGVLDYLLDPNKYYNCNPCRTELGLFAGNNVSLSKDNLVNIESDLRNQTRLLSRCPERKYLPQCEDCPCNPGLPCGDEGCQDEKDHLPACNIIQYHPRINHTGVSLNYPGCPVEAITSIDGQAMQHQPYINPVKLSECDKTEQRYGH